MKAIFLYLSLILLTTQCVTTTSVQEAPPTVGVIDIPQMDGESYYIRLSKADTVLHCLSSGLFQERVVDSLSTRRVISRPTAALASIMRTLSGQLMVTCSLAIDPDGEVVLTRVMDVSGLRNEDKAQEVAVMCFGYRYQADPSAPCLQFSELTIEIDGTSFR
jgi:hypothetical protein